MVVTQGDLIIASEMDVGFGVRVEGLGFRVEGLGVQGLGFRFRILQCGPLPPSKGSEVWAPWCYRVHRQGVPFSGTILRDHVATPSLGLTLNPRP